MKFSIVIPLYNKQSHIAETISSVLAQQWKNFELIIVDDGSTDKSLQRTQEFEDDRIKIIQKANGGSASARNVGIENSSGTHICLLDADDKYLPHFLNNIAELIETYPQAGVYGTNYLFQRKKKLFPPRLHGLKEGVEKELLHSYFDSVIHGEQLITNSSCCIPKQIITEAGGYDESIRTTEDQLLINTIALNYPVAFHHTVSAIYNQAAENMKTRRVPQQEIEFASRMQQMLENDEVPQNHIEDVKKIIAANLIGVAAMNLLAGDRKTAVKFLRDPRTEVLSEKRDSWLKLSVLPQFLLRSLYEIRRKVLNKR